MRDDIDCMTAAGCREDERDACSRRFTQAQQACPSFEAQTQEEGQACAGVSPGGFDEDEDWDEDEWCADADLCDGFEDCADGSDEEGCTN